LSNEFAANLVWWETEHPSLSMSNNKKAKMDPACRIILIWFDRFLTD
jgi:hypothetical protein